uniref:Uncharacterized protein n=1 Tax=feces metagenome TaxID=1861841 RepID=A0A7M2QNT3_9ZZZZ
MGKPTATARRGANGEVEYEIRNEPIETLARQFAGGPPGQNGVAERIQARGASGKKVDAAKESALQELYARETSEIQGRTASLGGVRGGNAQANITTNASTSSSRTAANPGQGDTQSQGDPDLSTSDNTARRRAGYRRDNGIRI